MVLLLLKNIGWLSMHKLYDKEKILKLNLECQKEFEEIKHKNIMEELKFMAKNKITSFSREAIILKIIK